jgi:uncharacterized membrane protein YagU involved in acid resistance
MATHALRFGAGPAIVAGVIAGLVFAVFEMITAALMMGPQAIFMPLRMIGAIVLGAAALDPSYSLVTAATAGVVVHMVLSVVFALLFALVAPSGASTTVLILSGIAFGTGLWLVNFYVIAPVIGWNWFPEQTNPVVQFLAHAFFYGGPIGWWLGSTRTVRISAA